jgi:hypothetical protein
VVVWIVLGIIWVAANPNKHHARSALEAKKVEGSIAISSGAH